MAKRKPKTPADLEKMADDANDAMSRLVAAGYIAEVSTIRNFIIEQGEHFKRTMRLQRDITRDIIQGKIKAEDAPEPLT